MAISESKHRSASPLRAALERHEVLASGAACGAAGGVLMMAVALVAAAVEDVALVRPLEVIGESFVGPGALGGTAARAAFGALVHLATAVGLGVVIAALIPRDFPLACSTTLAAGLAVFAMGVLTSLVVPYVNPGFVSGISVIGGAWVVAHVVFGAVAGLAPPLRRRLVGGSRTPSRSVAFAQGAASATPRTGA